MIKNTEIYKRINKWRWHERRISCGKEYPDKTFYVIRRHASHAGLFSFVSTNIGSIKYAVDQGYIPVIDMMNSINPMLKEEEVGKVNAWDEFFEQPCGFDLADISKAHNVILDNTDIPEFFPDVSVLNTDEEIAYWRDISKRYIHVNEEIKDISELYINDSFGSMKMLGVLCRGTDYLVNRPKDHPVQPDPEEVLNKTAIIMKKYGCEGIYLATEDEGIWNRFNDRFPGQVISYQKQHYSTDKGENINVVANKTCSPYERNKEYLISIYILSKCDCFIGGAAGGTVGALMFSDGFEYQYIYRLGYYR